MNSLLFPVFRLSRENSEPENMCDIIFEKTEGVYAEATVLKKSAMRNLVEFTRKHVSESLFFLIKLNFVDLRLL